MSTHRIESPVTGTVWKLECQPGDSVAAGDTLLIIESMKMEIPVEAPAAGVLKEVLIAEGDAIEEHQVLITLAS